MKKLSLLTLALVPAILLGTPESYSAEEERTSLVRKRVPRKITPAWGFDITGSPKFMGIARFTAKDTEANNTLEPGFVGMALDYRIADPKPVGSLTLGPAVSVMPLRSDEFRHLFFSYGARIQYMAEFVHEQAVVPVIGYQVNGVSYDLGDNRPRGTLMTRGPTGSIRVLLNAIDRGRGKALYRETGIRRFYLVADWRMMRGQDEAITQDGHAFHAGLRAEF